MQIVQILNDFIKVMYSPEFEGVCIADFILVKDLKNCYLGQVVEIEDDKFDNDKNIAKIKITHAITEKGRVAHYTRQITNKHAEVLFANQREIHNFINHGTSVIKIGQDIKYSRDLELSLNFFENKPVIFCDKFAEYTYIACELGKKLSNYENVVIFDYTGGIKIEEAKEIKAGIDFKLPLDFLSLDYIWKKGIASSSVETQAILGEIFNEIKNYAKNSKIGYIPFNRFVKIITKQYEATPIKELLVLKNRLIRYQLEELFANTKSDFKALSTKLNSAKISIIDMSNIKSEWQKDFTEFILRNIKNNSFVFIRINQNNYSNDLCTYMMSPKRKFKIIPSVSHTFTKLPLITENSFNSIIAQTLNTKKDFGYFGSLVENLDRNTYLFLGDDTKNFALIVKNINVEQYGTIQSIDIPEEKISLEGDVIKNKQAKGKIENLKEQKSKEISNIVDEFLYNRPLDDINKEIDTIEHRKIKIADLKNKAAGIKAPEVPELKVEHKNSEQVTQKEIGITKEVETTKNSNDFSVEDLITEDELDLYQNTEDYSLDNKSEEETQEETPEEISLDNDQINNEEEIKNTENQNPVVLDNESFSPDFLDTLEDINPVDSTENKSKEEIKNANEEDKQEIEELVNQSIEETFDTILNSEENKYENPQESEVEKAEVNEINIDEAELGKEDLQLENFSNEGKSENSIEKDIVEEETLNSDNSINVTPDLYDKEEDEFNIMNEIEPDIVSNAQENFESIKEDTSLLETKEEAQIEYNNIKENSSSENLSTDTDKMENTENNSQEEVIEFSDIEENKEKQPDFQISNKEQDENIPVILPDRENETDTEFFSENDEVIHPKYGKGKVLQVIEYSNKTLLQIDFIQIGKRLLDPMVAEIKKV